MSGGKQSLVTKFLKNHDPLSLLQPLVNICRDYNTDSWRIYNAIKRWWILKVSYPLFRRRVYKLESFTATLLFKHPDALILIVTRYVLYLISYAKIFNINPNSIISSIFPQNMIHMDMDTTQQKDDIRLDAFRLVVRSSIVLNLSKPEEDKYTITNLDINVLHNYYHISQICYDNSNSFLSKTSKILFNKEFRLSSDGMLENPNYVFNKGLLEEDLNYYRLMISQLMIFLGGIIDSTTTIFFLDKKENDYIL